MQWGDMYIVGTGASLPPSMPIDAAVSAGLYAPDEAERTQLLAVATANATQSAPDFAVAAARAAILRAECDPEDIGVLLYAVLLHAGVDLWNAASYIQRALGVRDALIAEIRSACNGALVGVELACSFLRSRPNHPLALVTAADCWPPTVLDRWRATAGFVFGDGGAAVVLSRKPGFARVLSVVTTTDPTLEGLNRGRESFGAVAQRASHIDLRRRAREFGEVMPEEELWRRCDDGLRSAVEAATREAEVSLSEIDHIVFPFVGEQLMQFEYLRPLGLRIEETTWESGRRIGNIGAGGALVGLNQLADSGRLVRGDHVLLVGIGGGFIWTAMVLQVLRDFHPSPGPPSI